MDQTHKEFVVLCNALFDASLPTLAGKLNALLTHTEQHFAQEYAWMQACNFPPTAIHQAEHERILALLAQTLQSVERGNMAAANSVINYLPDWFEQHTTTMDQMLAVYIKNSGIPT